MDVVYGIKDTLFYQLHNGKVCSVSRPLEKGFALEFCLGSKFNGFFLENRIFVEIRFVVRTPFGNRIEKVRINSCLILYTNLHTSALYSSFMISTFERAYRSDTYICLTFTKFIHLSILCRKISIARFF